jgi:two-component system, OmpR family, response regulator
MPAARPTWMVCGSGYPRAATGDRGQVAAQVGGDGGERGTILLIEDEEPIAELVTMYLERDGFNVVWRSDGRSGLAAVATERPRLVLLDLMLPGMDGFEVTRALRAGTQRVPLIIVTARDDEVDRVLGLELGADDYVTKPFSPRELAARVKAVLRRVEPDATGAPAAMRIGRLVIDPGRREVTMAGQPVQLTAREFDLLAHLVRNRGLVLTRDQILEAVWDFRAPADTRTVDVHIRQLRAKLGDGAPIRTVRGVGYAADGR